MTDATLDTGALVRLQRDRQTLFDLLATCRKQEIALITSAGAITEFLGGSPRDRRAAADWVASHFGVAPVSEVVARRGATLMRSALDSAPAASPGTVDALVVAEAERRGSPVVIAGDRGDFDPLAHASGRVRVIDIEELIG